MTFQLFIGKIHIYNITKVVLTVYNPDELKVKVGMKLKQVKKHTVCTCVTKEKTFWNQTTFQQMFLFLTEI